MKNILILGATSFLGWHLVDAALSAGDNVTIVNGSEGSGSEHPGVEQLRGSRFAELDLLSKRTWDAVIDTSEDPHYVEATAKQLQNSVAAYVYFSSVAAYADFREGGIDEDYPLRLTPRIDLQSEGSNKARSEKIVRDLYHKRALIVRPGMMAGKLDKQEHFTY